MKQLIHVSERWRLTVRLAAYTLLAVALLIVTHRVSARIAATASPSWTAEQLSLKEQLEAQLAARPPTHRLTLTDGRVIEVQIVTRTDAIVRVREHVGLTGQILTSYPRSKVRAIAPIPADGFAVTLADVELYQEFPTFKFAKFPPYTFVSDESFDTLEWTLRQLLALRRQFEARFAPLIRDADRPRNIQVVFFSNQEQFRAYATRAAPALVDTAGFYSVTQNRLALMNQFGSSHYNHLQKQMARSQRRLELLGSSGAVAARRLEAARDELDQMALAITERSINHEGAHQLFYAYRIQPPAGAEPVWLKEGLAEYCEPSDLGGNHPELAHRVADLYRAGKLLPLPLLLNYRADTGFVGLSAERAVAAYAESWALVYFLMQEPTRSRFFEFIKHYRDLDNPTAIAQLRQADVAVALAASLGWDWNTFESRWQGFLRQLR